MADSSTSLETLDVANDTNIVGKEDDRSQTMETVYCREPFLDNLKQHFNDDSFFDITLVVGDRRYPTLKTILAVSSPYFQRMFFGGDWKEGQGADVTLEETTASEEVFGTFLQYFYTASISVSMRNVQPLVILADKYDVKTLKDLCSKFMSTFVSRADDIGLQCALTWLSFAEQMHMGYLEQKCYDMICFNLEKASALKEWLSLSVEQLIVILKRYNIVVPSEYTIYVAVHKWLVGNKTALNKLGDIIDPADILCHVQFKNMTPAELLQVEKSLLASNSKARGTERGSVKDQISVHVVTAWRYIACAKDTTDRDVPADDEQVPIQRIIYRSSTLMETALSSNGVISLKPSCYQYNTDCNQFQWHLKIARNNFHVVLPQISTGIIPNGRCARQFLSTYLPGIFHVKLLIAFRHNDGAIFDVMNHSVDTQLPSSDDGGVLVTLPQPPKTPESSDSKRYSPHDILYTFEIQEKKLSPLSGTSSGHVGGFGNSSGHVGGFGNSSGHVGGFGNFTFGGAMS